MRLSEGTPFRGDMGPRLRWDDDGGGVPERGELEVEAGCVERSEDITRRHQPERCLRFA